MGYTFFWVKFSNAFANFVVSCLLTRWRFIQCKYLFWLQDQTVPYTCSSWQACENMFLHKKAFLPISYTQ